MKFTRSGDTIKIYRFSADSKDWTICKNEWQTVDNVLYYLNNSGLCEKIYDNSSKKAKSLSSGKLVQVKNQMLILNVAEHIISIQMVTRSQRAVGII